MEPSGVTPVGQAVQGKHITNVTATATTEEAITESMTSAQKRKAEVEIQGRKSDNKKVRSTYTPKTQAKRPLRRSAAPGTPGTQSVDCQRSNMPAVNDDSAPVRMVEIRNCFEELGRNLASTLTKDFTKTITVVSNQVNTNTKNIEDIRSTIRQIKHEAHDN